MYKDHYSRPILRATHGNIKSTGLADNNMRISINLSACTLLLASLSQALPRPGSDQTTANLTLTSGNLTIPPSFTEIVKTGLDYLNQKGVNNPYDNIAWIMAEPPPGSLGRRAGDFDHVSILIDQPANQSYIFTRNVPLRPTAFIGVKTVLYKDAPRGMTWRFPFKWSDIEGISEQTAFDEASEVLQPPYDSLQVVYNKHNFFWSCHDAQVLFHFFQKTTDHPEFPNDAIYGTRYGGAKRIAVSDPNVSYATTQATNAGFAVS